MRVLPAVMILLWFAALEAAPADRMTPLDLREVTVGGEIGRRVTITIANNLLQLNVDGDFLPAFREGSRNGQFIGLGMLLDSTVKFAAHSGHPRVMELKRHLVTEILKAQEAEGYIGTFPPPGRLKSLWDVHEMGYIIFGLLQDHEYFGNRPALEAARKAAGYLIRNWAMLPPDWGHGAEVAPHVAFTGLERTMLALHRATGDSSYLDFCIRMRALPEWDPDIVVGRRPGIDGHVYAYLARCLAQLELHPLQPSARLLRPTQRALDFMTGRDGMLITGSCGQCEIWTADQDGRGDVGESCALAYQLRIYDRLLRMNAEARMGDLMERVIFNALFASQSPDGRRLRYFAPLEGNRVYWNTDTYCCPCNFRRIIAELPAMVFYRSAEGLAVNLYAPSEGKFILGNQVRTVLRQETDYPNSGRVRIHVGPDKPSTFPLLLRIPAWAGGATASVNGQAVPAPPLPGTFLELRREWKPGDRIELDLPMPWRLVQGRQRQAGRVAVMRGPQVFCLNPSPNQDLARLDGAELGYLALNPASFTDPAASDAVRPGGIACRVQAWKPGFGLGSKADYELTLTEFPDPLGKAVYFRLRDYRVAREDELFRRAGP